MMRCLAFTASALLLAAPAFGLAQAAPLKQEKHTMTPALEHYTQSLVLGELWQRPGLSPRDRSIVTLSVLVTKNQAHELPFYLKRALDNGVRPGEIAELITHLAFYSGWGNASAADAAARAVFAERKIAADQLPPAKPAPLPLDEKVESARAKNVEANFGKTAPGVVKYTTEALFRDLWLRPGLAPRDRSLVVYSSAVSAKVPKAIRSTTKRKRSARSSVFS